jgi:hypothetical protein
VFGWQVFRERSSGRKAIAKRTADGQWKVWRGLIGRKYAPDEFEKKYDAAR